MGDRKTLYPIPGYPRDEAGLLDLSRHYSRPVLDRLTHFPPHYQGEQQLHIKRERRDSTPYLEIVKQEPEEETLPYHREEREMYEPRELPRSFSLPAPRDTAMVPPERQVSLERTREGGVQGVQSTPPVPKQEGSSRTVIGNTTVTVTREHRGGMCVYPYSHHTVCGTGRGLGGIIRYYNKV